MDEVPDLLPVEPGYKNVLRVRLALVWLFIAGAALIAAYALAEATLFAAALPILALVTGSLSSQSRRCASTGGSATGSSGPLAAGRPRLAVPHRHRRPAGPGPAPRRRSRPFDKMFGTASLVVHTAGTHNSVVTVPGLAPDRAAEMRDIIREHVRTDFA